MARAHSAAAVCCSIGAQHVPARSGTNISHSPPPPAHHKSGSLAVPTTCLLLFLVVSCCFLVVFLLFSCFFLVFSFSCSIGLPVDKSWALAVGMAVRTRRWMLLDP